MYLEYVHVIISSLSCNHKFTKCNSLVVPFAENRVVQVSLQCEIKLMCVCCHTDALSNCHLCSILCGEQVLEVAINYIVLTKHDLNGQPADTRNYVRSQLAQSRLMALPSIPWESNTSIIGPLLGNTCVTLHAQ